jgi:acetyltransferase-like isoleucine patch superfamily enzyme
MLRENVERVAGDAIHAAWRGVTRLGAIGPRHRRARAFHTFGDGAMIAFPQSVIFGEGRIALGNGSTIGPLASISAGMPSQADLRGEPIITIGERCTLGKGIGIVGHERVEIGDDIWTGHYVYITDQNHGYEDVTMPIGTQMWHNKPVSIGSGSWLGHGCIVLPGVHVGEHVVIAAGAVVADDVPDRCVVAGVPARIVRRYAKGEGWVRE